MKRGEDFIRKEDISMLNQLVESLEEAGLKLEEAYKNKDYRNFDNSKKIILQVQKRISEIVK